ncbi:nucleotidyltransferase family protein [Chthonobacter rhizosphaerae]|uniref:nucleotidyltransferase family protein n=1 Tax=Chthonobacter rhizosphaerae TaxID=2735553 RepID=UPI0015EF82B6|nr:nucleotidyltransferase domain-containing protein [Chthonobacter rhizosphaerae]
MSKTDVMERLRQDQRDLRSRGVVSAALFGSVARGDAGPESDIDIVVRLDERRVPKGLGFFGFLDDLQQDLGRMLGRSVDVIPEPRPGSRLEREIAKDRSVVF